MTLTSNLESLFLFGCDDLGLGIVLGENGFGGLELGVDIRVGLIQIVMKKIKIYHSGAMGQVHHLADGTHDGIEISMPSRDDWDGVLKFFAGNGKRFLDGYAGKFLKRANRNSGKQCSYKSTYIPEHDELSGRRRLFP